MAEVDHLARIVERKRIEVARRQRWSQFYADAADARGRVAVDPTDALRRSGDTAGVIAEIKTRSPSAGEIRPRRAGELVAIARSYESNGASAVSVLCDAPGFGGCPMDLKRVADSVDCPVLFKEFVVAPSQVDLARAVGASLVLLLVRVLEDRELRDLSAAIQSRGMQPVVEAADAVELERALRLDVPIVGINARNLRSFQVDSGAASALVDRIPADRVAVSMSGIRSPEDLRRVSRGRADVVLVGEGLMRAAEPGARLAELIAPA